MSTTVGVASDSDSKAMKRPGVLRQVLHHMFVDDRPPIRRIEITHRRDSLLGPMTRACLNFALLAASTVVAGACVALLASSVEVISQRPELRAAAEFLIDDLILDFEIRHGFICQRVIDEEGPRFVGPACASAFPDGLPDESDLPPVDRRGGPQP